MKHIFLKNAAFIFSILIMGSVFAKSYEGEPECFEGDCMLCLIGQESNSDLVKKAAAKYNLKFKKNGPVSSNYEGKGIILKAYFNKILFIVIHPKKFDSDIPYYLNAGTTTSMLSDLFGDETKQTEIKKKKIKHDWSGPNNLVISAIFNKEKLVEIQYSFANDESWKYCEQTDKHITLQFPPHRSNDDSKPEEVDTRNNTIPVESKPEIKPTQPIAPIQNNGQTIRSTRYKTDFPKGLIKCKQLIESKDPVLKEKPVGDKWSIKSNLPAGAMDAYYEETTIFGFKLYSMNIRMEDYENDTGKIKDYYDDLYDGIQLGLGQYYKPVENTFKRSTDEYENLWLTGKVKFEITDPEKYKQVNGADAATGTVVFLELVSEFNDYDGNIYYSLFVTILANNH